MNDSETINKISEQLHAEVKEKTRFKKVDIRVSDFHAKEVIFSLPAQYKYKAVITSKKINGYFNPQSNDVVSSDPDIDTETAANELLILAPRVLSKKIQTSPYKYTAVKSGILIKNPQQYWRLDPCLNCDPKGKVTCPACKGSPKWRCSPCNGEGRIRCRKCGGTCLHSCPACTGTGRVSCRGCYGNGSNPVQKPVSVTRTVYDSSGEVRTVYETEMQTVYETCSICAGTRYSYCPSCSGTRQVICNCNAGKEKCSGCDGAGIIICRGCAGDGNVACPICAGSKKTGVCKSCDIEVITEFSTPSFIEEAPDSLAVDFLKSRNLAEFLSESSPLEIISFENINNQVKVNYQSALYLSFMNITCEDNDYAISVAGNSLILNDTTKIIEDLAESDLISLEKITQQLERQKIWQSDNMGATVAVKNIMESSNCLDMIKALASDTKAKKITTINTALTHNQRIMHVLPRALQLITHNVAKKYSEWVLFCCLIVFIGIWLVSITISAMAVSLMLAWLLFRRFDKHLLKTLSKETGFNPVTAEAASLCLKIKPLIYKYYILVPALILFIVLFIITPFSGPFSGGGPFDIKNKIQNKFNESSHSATVFDAPEIATALHDIGLGHYKEGLKRLKTAADEKKNNALGAYAWAVLATNISQHKKTELNQIQNMTSEALRNNSENTWATASQGIIDILKNPARPAAATDLEKIYVAINKGNTVVQWPLAYIGNGNNKVDKKTALNTLRKISIYGEFPQANFESARLRWEGSGQDPFERANAIADWKKAAAMQHPAAINALNKLRKNKSPF